MADAHAPAAAGTGTAVGVSGVAAAAAASDGPPLPQSRPRRRAITAAIVASVAVNAVLAWRLWGPADGVRTGSAGTAAVVMRTPGGLLEVSRIATEERFDSTTQHTVLGVPLGETVAQVRVPAVYRYRIPLAPEWKLRLSGDTLLVVAPAVEPALPVAVDTARLEAFSRGLWSPLTGADAVAALQRSITAQLAAKAAAPALVQLQREAARQTVGEFVRKWVIGQPRWQGTKAPTVFVFFADEPLGRQAAPLLSEAAQAP